MATTGISEPSIQSLLVIAHANQTTATAFVVVYNRRNYLVTNWHVVTGRHPENGEVLSSSGAVPDDLEVWHNVQGQLGRWEARREPLYDASNRPRWFEHPVHGRRVDVVVLSLTDTAGVDLYPYDPVNPGPLIAYGPSDAVSIIGFPKGLTHGGRLAIWKQGTVATEPDVDFDDLPCFLVDARTLPGQSGSPVIAFRAAGGGYTTEAGATILGGAAAQRFVGVFSADIGGTDLGSVWKVSALVDILTARKRGPRPRVGPPP